VKEPEFHTMQREIHPWQEIEISLHCHKALEHPYLDVDAWIDFTHVPSSRKLRRPAYWAGGQVWKVRFASPESAGNWTWQSDASIEDSGLIGQTGCLTTTAKTTENRFFQKGFWRMSAGKRNLEHADGSPALLCGDTAWALPWRATSEQVAIYAQDRQAKGFNAALLMTVQPDMEARGPESRSEDLGFAIAFDDLPQGHINQIRPEYFQYLDQLIDQLIAHEIVPVYQPIFHGYGWKGQKTAGSVIPPDEYARFCRYLVARYGARPAIYLVGADGYGPLDSIRAGGEMIQAEDAYQQPTGMHYNPMAKNNSYQACEWLDFQWCQTGHNQEHLPERVMDMWHQQPPKAVCNAEPTYERMEGFKATGWWQGHEAWTNLCAGGTMGVVYGAASLWQWRLHPNEPGHATWCSDPESGWREALDFEGSQYPGILARILERYEFTDMQPDWTFTLGIRGLSAGNHFALCYLEKGGSIEIVQAQNIPDIFTVFCARTGKMLKTGRVSQCNPIQLQQNHPMLIIFGQKRSNTSFEHC
jgi:hypothetical protein